MVNQEMSDTFMCNMGVRQGEILSPLLFALCVSDKKEKFIEYNCKHLDVDDDLLNAYLRILVLIFADNTVLLCDSELSMIQTLTSFHKYCSEWKLNVNVGETKK